LQRKKLHFVQSLARGLSVLQAFSAERPALRLSEIAQLTGLNMAAAQRFTDTLLQLGFLHRNRHREFLLGPKVLSLGFTYLNGNQLKAVAKGFLDEFADRHRRTMNLGVLEDDAVIFLYRRESQRFLKYDLQAGSRMPSYCTATGKTLLAGLADDALRAVLRSLELKPITSRTLTDPAALWADLMETRRRGWAVCDRELSLDLYSVGIPINDQEGRVAAAVNLSLSVEEARGERLRAMLAELMELGRGLSATFDYQGPYPAFPEPAPEGETL
jgi:IclR family pca regulon transcriptional regulator